MLLGRAQVQTNAVRHAHFAKESQVRTRHAAGRPAEGGDERGGEIRGGVCWV